MNININSKKKWVFAEICTQGYFSEEGGINIIETDDITTEFIEDNGLCDYDYRSGLDSTADMVKEVLSNATHGDSWGDFDYVMEGL